jgi:hypothetical protein
MPKSKRRNQQKKTRVAQTGATPAALTPQSTRPREMPAAVARSSFQAATGAARHPFVAGELKRIGILTAAILVVLVILAFALPRFI